MGLPVANIICACAEGSPAWSLLTQGRVRNLQETMPELERLLFATLGIDEVLRLRDQHAFDGMLDLSPLMLDALRKGLEPAIVSDSRVNDAIPNVYRTNSYILEPGTAKAYSGLMDYRAKHRVTRAALLLAEHSPQDRAKIVTDALGISKDRLKELLR
jgi:hypothetical protein